MNPLQQGLKHEVVDGPSMPFTVAIMNPLQQGLKHSELLESMLLLYGCNNESTTTRIETYKSRM